MAQFELKERDLLGLIQEAIGHPDIQPVDFGLSGRVFVDHVIGRFEKAIDDYGSPQGCPEIIRKGYEALKQLYPLHFRE